MLIAALLARLLLVMLFLPFSAWDKVFNFRGAVAQAGQIGFGLTLCRVAILCALALEIIGSAMVLTGFFDRLAAGLLSLYCVTTAVLYKRWWAAEGEVFSPRDTDARALFFDFWKNLALAGGFLVLVVGPDGSGLAAFFADPLASALREGP